MPSIEGQISRRTLISGGVATGVLIGLGVPQIARASEFLSSAREVRPGRYFPQGAGLAEPLRKFAAVAQAETGEPAVDNIETYLSIFASRGCTEDPSCGDCGPFTNYQVSEDRLPVRNVALKSTRVNAVFTPDELDAIGTVYHDFDYCTVETFGDRTFTYDPNNPLQDVTEPIYFHNMFVKYLGKLRVPLGIDRTDVAGQMWSNPVDQGTFTVSPIGGGMIRVDASLRAANYVENVDKGQAPYRFFNFVYEVDPNDPYNPGRFLTDAPKRIWRPDFDPKTGQGPQLAGYDSRNNILTPKVMNLYRRLLAAAS